MIRVRLYLVLALLAACAGIDGWAQLQNEDIGHPPAVEEHASRKSDLDTVSPAGVKSDFVTTVKVDGDATNIPDTLTPAVRMTQAEILSTAGTFGDFTRALQVLPGVLRTSDLSNDLIVRGGHPTENLFVIDGVEIPNINHFALSGSNGGLTSMVDSSAVGSIALRTDGYDAGYSSRLSSLIEIQTRRLGETKVAREFTLGIDGAGGLYERKMERKGNLLLSAHRSVVNLLTNDIGINGVPVLTNALLHLDIQSGAHDNLSLLSLSGSDSIAMTPCPSDASATSTIETQYSGWRSAGGLSWVHSWSPAAATTLNASYSIDSHKIGQQQENGFLYDDSGKVTCLPAALTPVYSERSRNGTSTLTYQVRAAYRGWMFLVGASARLIQPKDNVAQPAGESSPFNVSAAKSDAVTFSRNFISGHTASFVQAERGVGARWQLVAGIRAETFAVNSSYALNPRVAASYKLNGRQNLHGAVSIASQLPPTMDLLSYPANRSMRPITVRLGTVGMRLWQGGWGTLDVEAYEKSYLREPVSTEYPQLMLSNMVDMLGQAFVWLPLASSGTAKSEGLEISLRTHWGDRIQALVALAQSQDTYRALDGIRRPGNYSTPAVVNAIGTLRVAHGVQADWRESFTSGLPYCPFDLPDSLEQMRGIYDLTRINALRAPPYNRLDVELERSFHVGKGALEVHAGAENIFNRGNLRGFVWEQLCQPGWACNNKDGEPIARVDQMGRYPVASFRYKF